MKTGLIALLAAVLLALVPGQAAASAAPKLRACGNLEVDGLLVGDITTKRVICPTARKVAREAPRACGDDGTCTVRGFSCITARALEELRFARCSKPGNGAELFEVIRFDFGS